MLRLPTILLSSLLTLALQAQQSAVVPVLNLTSGTEHESIAEGVENASPGDHLQLAPASFTEHVAIGIPLTISGSETGTTIIDVSQEDGWGITLSSDGITLEDFTVTAGGVNTAYAIHSEPGITDLTIEDVEVYGSTRTCIDLNGLTGPGFSTIRNITVSGSAIGFGLALSTCSNVHIENVTSSDNGYGDIAIMESNYYDQEIHDLVFTGSLNLEGPENLGGGGVIVQIDPAEVPVGGSTGFPVVMDADGYDYLLEAPGDLTGCILVHSDDVRSIAATLGAQVTPLVSYDLVTQNMVVFPGMSVQSAVNAAEEATVIEVEVGSFDTAPIEINTSVTLVGPNAGITGEPGGGRGSEAVIPGIMVAGGHPVVDGLRLSVAGGNAVEVLSDAGGLTMRNSVIVGNGTAGSQGIIARNDVILEHLKVSGFTQAIVQHDGGLQTTSSTLSNNGTQLSLVTEDGMSGSTDFSFCTFESTGGTGLHIASGDAADLLVMTGCNFNLHGTAFHSEDAISWTLENNVFTNSEKQVEGLDRSEQLLLCADNTFDPVLRITGCTDETADNFEPCATVNHDCQYLGCTSPKACNFDASANVDDGSCDFITCAACPLGFACNYDPDAELYKVEACDFTDCEIEGMAEVDGERTLTMTIEGCTIPQACNYDASADTEDGSCTFDCYGCMDDAACNFDAVFTQSSNETCLYQHDLHTSPHVDCDGVCLEDVNGNGICDPEEVHGCMDAGACNFDADATLDDGGCDFLTCAGCTNPAACNHDADAVIADASCDYSSCSGCTDVNACNYDATASIDDGSCVTPVDLYNKDYLDCDAGCLNDADGDGICDEEEIAGCTDPEACNYHEEATDDDGNCDFLTCTGCTDADYCNFNPAATVDNGSCATPEDLYPDSVVDGVATVDCLGRCINDEDGDGICDEAEVVCPGDLNDDGLRGAADILVLLSAFGCTEGCGSPDLNGDGLVAASDILMALSTFGVACPQ